MRLPGEDAEVGEDLFRLAWKGVGGDGESGRKRERETDRKCVLVHSGSHIRVRRQRQQDLCCKAQDLD